MRQKKTTLANQMRSLHTEIGDTAWSDEQRSKWDAMKSDLSNLDTQIEREEELRSLDQSFSENNQEQHQEHRNGGQEKTAEQRQKQAFDVFVRSGLGEMDPELRSVLKEMRAQGTDPDTSGGFTVPKEFQSRVIDKMKAYGGVANIANVIYTSNGRELPWATSDGTEEVGELVGENTQTGEGDTTFGTVSLGAKNLSSKVIRASNALLQDSGVDMEAYLTGRIAMRIGRGESKLLITGSGTGTPLQPKGLGASVTGSTTTAATDFNWKDLTSLKHAVDPAYREGQCYWLFNDNTLKIVSDLVDGQNRPIWLPALSTDVPATILGKPYQIDQGVADAEANAKFAYFGDFSKFIVRRVNGMMIKRLVERYADYDQTGFLAFHRFDCLLEDTAAIKALVLKAA
ncbi:hypothetical protein CAPTEDRAFT_203748 [Capitella teleta]|uniref:Phage capsid-like C-terminal domain-containing protein n=1 Tax=Capitella teleta TaxID=283909 RepID=R7VCI8_CAPTE|nr:hypothetical protein CAPTEDRAFT_203748 [Capitella teleta]|eukprot:ELU16553.1 hypothetical protein CAPTEDRAFT_203748 [Capitella teleta]